MKTNKNIEPSLVIIGGIFSAALASICCWGPIVLALLGVSIGAITFFTEYRLVFIILAAILLGRALYLAYRSKNKNNIIIIWIFIFIAALFILYPYLKIYLTYCC